MSNLAQSTQEAATAAIAGKATYTGAGATVLGWLVSSEFTVLAGLLIGVVGLVVKWYYSWREDRRQQIEHEHRMKGLK